MLALWKGIELDFEFNKNLISVYNRIIFLHKYLKYDGFTGRYDIGFLQNNGGLDDQDWEWVEDIEFIKNEFNSLKK